MKSSIQTPSRRLFLQQAASLSGLACGAPLALNLAAMGSAAAQSTGGDYKALVCIFLAGGNDTYNTVLATDASSWNAYTATRNQYPSSIALSAESVLPLSPAKALAGGRSIALHPQLTGVQSLFNVKRKLSIVSNVGPLVEPLTKDDFSRQLKRQPSKLFSHNDQQSTWQSLSPEGATVGWGGRLADIVASGNGNSLFTGISAAGNSVWLAGNSVKQYQMQSVGAVKMGITSSTGGIDKTFGSQEVAAALKRIVASSRRSSVFDNDVAEVARRSIAAERALGGALPSADQAPYGPANTLQYVRPDGSYAANPLAQQLQVIARTIGARTTLGMKRQVFFVSLGGFDTHDDQLSRHADLMARLNHGLVYFDNVLTSMGLSDNVTTFTASDFGRTFTSNGDGTDHGWGAHHFVMGGAVQGGTVVGEMPVYSVKNSNNNQFDGSADQVTNGSLLPKISVDQYGAALGRWFGAGSALPSIFPNLSNFGEISGLMRA